ncbi:MAG: hotdog domain-containing protein [Peptoniphilus sp.]|nr:hotdog domain-containing protein [Peptoniphilus sp.]MDY3118276.1 hotdog domain-containing protein [Peptoniphilus sp.]
MTAFHYLEEGLDHRLMADSELEILEQDDERLTAKWTVWPGALNSVGTCQGMIHFGMADVISAILCNRDGVVVTRGASCFYHAPLYEGEVRVEAFFNKRGKVNDNVEVHFFQEGELCYQAIFNMHATGVVLDKGGGDEA